MELSELNELSDFEWVELKELKEKSDLSEKLKPWFFLIIPPLYVSSYTLNLLLSIPVLSFSLSSYMRNIISGHNNKITKGPPTIPTLEGKCYQLSIHQHI